MFITNSNNVGNEVQETSGQPSRLKRHAKKRNTFKTDVSKINHIKNRRKTPQHVRQNVITNSARASLNTEFINGWQVKRAFNLIRCGIARGTRKKYCNSLKRYRQSIIHVLQFHTFHREPRSYFFNRPPIKFWPYFYHPKVLYPLLLILFKFFGLGLATLCIATPYTISNGYSY